MDPQFAYSNENMKSYHEHQRIKIIRCVLVSILFGFLLVVSLHQTSEHMKNYMFSPPEELEEWEDHIQIAILLRGKLIRQKCKTVIFKHLTYKATIYLVLIFNFFIPRTQ